MDITFGILPVILSYLRVSKLFVYLGDVLDILVTYVTRVFTRAEILLVCRIILSKRNIFYFLARLYSALFYFISWVVRYVHRT